MSQVIEGVVWRKYLEAPLLLLGQSIQTVRGELYPLRRIWGRVGVPGGPLIDIDSFCPPTCEVLPGTVSRNALPTLALRCGSELSAWNGKAGKRKQHG